MRGRRLEKTGSVLVEYVEDFFGPSTPLAAFINSPLAFIVGVLLSSSHDP